MNSPRRLAQTWSCCKAPTSQLSHLVLIVTFPDMDLLNLEFKDEVTLLPGAPLMALTQHWLEADKDPVWSHFQVCALCAQARSMFSGRATGTHVSAAERAAPQRTPSATDGPSPPPPANILRVVFHRRHCGPQRTWSISASQASPGTGTQQAYARNTPRRTRGCTRHLTAGTTSRRRCAERAPLR